MTRTSEIEAGRSSPKSVPADVPKDVGKSTDTDRFIYVLAVAKIVGVRTPWEHHRPFRDAFGGNPVTIISFRDMILDIQRQATTTLAASEVGRMLQLFQVAGIHVDAD